MANNISKFFIFDVTFDVDAPFTPEIVERNGDIYETTGVTTKITVFSSDGKMGAAVKKAATFVTEPIKAVRRLTYICVEGDINTGKVLKGTQSRRITVSKKKMQEAARFAGFSFS